MQLPFLGFVALFFSFPAAPDFGQVGADESSIHGNSPSLGLTKDSRLFHILTLLRAYIKAGKAPVSIFKYVTSMQTTRECRRSD
jgi:hypothetical protein